MNGVKYCNQIIGSIGLNIIVKS